MSKKTIINEILAERERLDAQWGGAEHDDQLTQLEWKSVFQSHCVMLAHKLYDVPGAGGYKTHVPDDYRERLIKIAALAVAALESYDRKAGR